MSATQPTARRPALLPAILVGGLAGGLIDFVGACLIYRLPPLTVGKAVARGWFGKASMQGGMDVALIGIASHFAIVIVAAAVFVLASLRLPVLRGRAWITGPLFGLAVYVFMHFMVLPLSAAGPGNPQGIQLAEELVSHALLGLAISLSARRFVDAA